MKIEILRPGIHTTVQDLGRAGFRSQGVASGGALNPALAEALAATVAAFDPKLIVFTLAHSALARAAQAAGLRVAREVFADRNYLADGSLVPRSRPDALLHDADEAAARVLRMLREGLVTRSMARTCGSKPTPCACTAIRPRCAASRAWCAPPGESRLPR